MEMLVPMPVGADGSIDSVPAVKSIHGIGKMETGWTSMTPVIVGKPTYMKPKPIPIIAPIEKSRHRQVSSLLDASARAVAPCAVIGASGYGSFSPSDISRYSTYPKVNHATREKIWVASMTTIAGPQSRWTKVRSRIAADSVGGVTQLGTCSPRPPGATARKNEFQMSPANGPPESAKPPVIAVRPPAM